MLLLDTDHISIIQWPAAPEYSRLAQRMRQHPPTAFYFSIVSFHEQVIGAHAYINRSRATADALLGYDLLERIRADYGRAQVLRFDQAAGLVFDSLRSQRVRISTMDLRIGAIALARDFTVLTRNVSDFRQVPGLKVEDWTV